jgi:hypothetical protein
MNAQSIQQEILLVTTSRFWRKQLHQNHAPDGKNRGQQRKVDQEDEEKACWDGLPEEILPEIFPRASSGQELYKMYLHRGRKSIQIGMSELFAAEQLFESDALSLTIHPYYFFTAWIPN